MTYGPPAHGRPLPRAKTVIVVSRNIRPYLEAVAGLKAGLSKGADAQIEVIDIGASETEEQAEFPQRLAGGDFDLLVGVGPEAGLQVEKAVVGKNAIKLYLMVLNPRQVFGSGAKTCGISLDIPVHTQVEMIRKGLPSIRRLGLLYDPLVNSDFFSQALPTIAMSGLTIVPLRVSSKKDIPSVLKAQWKEVDALWLIPDRTVISESIINYVIKEAFLRKAPVIGYNRFFYETGAALAFVLDYRELGMQCATQALSALAGEACTNASPLFHVWVNPLVARKLGLMLPKKYLPPIQLGP